jgi:hypothetical protein
MVKSANKPKVNDLPGIYVVAHRHVAPTRRARGCRRERHGRFWAILMDLSSGIATQRW